MSILYRNFYDIDSVPPNHWDLKYPFNNIQRFVNAAEKSGYKLRVFIKSDSVSEEERDVWTTDLKKN